MAGNDPVVTRRLAAILIADVVGYTRLMERDDTGTFSRLRTIRDEVVEPSIVSHGGRIVKTAGDGLMAEFASALSALRAAVQVQREMQSRNADVPSDERIEYRIGINLGDVMVDGSDLAGDGINVAARLEALCEAGGICVSGSVREQVHGTLDVDFDDIGEQQVKNIARPIRAFAVRTAGGGASDANADNTRGARPPRTRIAAVEALYRLPLRKSAAIMLALSVTALAAAGSYLLWSNWHKSATPVPPAFSVAVLPFIASGGTPADQQFADLVTQSTMTALGRTERYARIVAPRNVPTGTSKPLDTRALGRELNVRFVVGGDVHVDGDSASVTIKLLDAESATQLWSRDFNATRSQWIADPAKVAWPLTTGLGGALWYAEQQRVAHEPKGGESPWDLVLRAGLAERNRSLAGILEARKLLDEALRLDPTFTSALVGRAWINAELWEVDPNADRIKLAQEMDEFARRALAIDRAETQAWRARSTALSMQWRWDAAFEAGAEASRLEPLAIVGNGNDRGWMLSMTGRADEALKLFDEVIALRPDSIMDPNFRHNQCYAYILLGQFETAVPYCEKSVAGGDDWWPHLFLTAAYARTGNMVNAAASKAELLRRRPSFSIAQFNAMGLSDNPVYLKQAETNFLPGLRKAGIPEK